MSELLRKAAERAIILKKRPHLRPPASTGVNAVGQHRTRQALRRYLREANPEQAHRWPELPDIEENGQLRLLTRRLLGMRLKEFRYYQPPGGFYGNPYDKDFAQERQKERRNGLIKAGIVGAGLLGGGALLGRGLYKVGNSGAVRRAEDLAEELSKLRASKAAANVGNVGNAAPAPRGRKTQNNTPPPTPPQTPTPTPPPQTPPPSAPPTPPTGKKTTPKKVVENLNQQGDLPAGTAAAEIDEITAAGEAPKPPRKLTKRQQELAARKVRVAKAAAAQGTASTPAPAAPAAVVPKTKAPVAAKTETPAASKSPTKPAASSANEGLVEIEGVGKFPFTGTPEQSAAFRKRLEETRAAGGFKGKAAADVVDEIRQSLKSDFPEGLSAKMREAGRANNKNLKPKKAAKRNSKEESKAKKDADDDLDDDLDEADDINEPDASAEEADWEAKLKENPQVRAKSGSKKPAAKAAAKPAAKSKKGKKEAAPLSYAERLAAKVKAKRDKKPAAKKNGKNLSALLQRVRYFNQFQTDEAGIPLTGRVARDRFVKKIRDEDLDRRDANILRAGGAGALAGLLARGRIGASKRALIGAGAGGLGVLGIRALTKNDRDIYGERDRGSKRAELLPAVGGLGAAAWLAGKRLKAFAKKIDHRGHGEHGGVKEFGIASRIEYLTGQTHFRGAKEILERGKNYRRARDWARGRGDDSLAAEKAGRAKEFIKTARLFRNEGSRRRNISIGVGAGALGAGVGGAYLATRPKKSLAARLRGVKEFGSMSHARLMRKLASHLSREKDHVLISKMPNAPGHPDVRVASARPSHAAWFAKESNLLNKLAYKREYGQNREDFRWLTGRGTEEARGRARALLAENAAVESNRKRQIWRNMPQMLAARLRGVKEFNDPHRPDWAVHPSGGSLHVQSLVYKPQNYVPRWGLRRLLASKSDKVRSDAFDQAMRERERRRSLREAAMQKESSLSSRLRGVKEFTRYWNPSMGWPAEANTPDKKRELLEAHIRRRQLAKAGIFPKPRAVEITSGYDVKTGKNLSARLRGVKSFDDYRLYYFKGRNTGIAAKSVEEARKKKKRGGDELVAVRTPNATEKSQMARGVWVRTRRDGKSPGQSRYGKGRGQGPARKSLSARFDHRGHGGHGEISGKLREESNLASRLYAVRYFEKNNKRDKRGLNPYVGAALSGFGSGAALGSLALLRRGATFRGAAKTAGKLGLASAGIVGGGALLGSKIVGDPRKEESAPFMKRAAIGGTLVGAGAGLGGALLLRKTKGGARALVAASKKSEPFSRPAMWLRKAPLAGAAGIGAVGGALYGGGMGADEGQQVDSIRNLRKDMKKFSVGSFQFSGKRLREFSAKLRFFGRGDQARWDARRGGGVGPNEDSQFANTAWGWATDRPMYVPKRDDTGRTVRDKDGNAVRLKWDPSSGQLWNSIAREAKNKRVTVQRGGRLSRDLVDELRGAPRQRDASGRIKKREWEKGWFQNKATEIGMTAAGLGGLATVRYANNNPDTKIGKAYTNTKASLRATGDGLSEIGGNILKGLTKVTAKRAFSAKLKRLRELDAIAEYEGWDVRDPRGRSARVFAPGSRRRERRPKEWYEKTENERKLWKAGIGAGVLGGVGLTLVGQRLISGKSLIPSRFLKKKPIDPSKFADAPPSAKEADEILKKYSK